MSPYLRVSKSPSGNNNLPKPQHKENGKSILSRGQCKETTTAIKNKTRRDNAMQEKTFNYDHNCSLIVNEEVILTQTIIIQKTKIAK